MSTTKEQMLLKALSEYSRTHTSFRNRHLAQLSGLARQDVNHYLNKWQEKGFVSKNPLVSGEWILIDLQGLVADIIEPTEPAKMGHARHELFDKDILTKLQCITELYAALRSLKTRDVKLKASIEDYINAAINELRNERTFMHTKQYSPERARQVVKKHEAYAVDLGLDIAKIIGPDKPSLTLVSSEE